MSTTPDLAYLLQSFSAKILDNLRVALPCQVVSVEPDNRSVTVRIASLIPDHSAESIRYIDMPDLPAVPVQTVSNSRVSVDVQISSNDTGLLVFSDVALGAFLSSQGVGSTPPSSFNHLWSGAVFIPGLAPTSDSHPLPTGDVQVRIGDPNGVRVEVTDSEIRALDGSSKELAFKSDVDAVAASLLALQAIFNAHIHALNSPPTATLTTTPPSTENPIVEGTTILKGE